MEKSFDVCRFYKDGLIAPIYGLFSDKAVDDFWLFYGKVKRMLSHERKAELCAKKQIKGAIMLCINKVEVIARSEPLNYCML